MKRKIILSTFLVLILGISIIIIYPLGKPKIIFVEKETTNSSSFISMMIEIEEGEYLEKTDIKFPNEEYLFNPEKSGCENGGTLSWNSEKQKIEASLITSDKCYAYFDKYDFTKSCKFGYEDNLACEIIKNKDNTLIYHDGKCDYEGEENCDLEAGDNNYRYAGANNDVNNYVCLDSKETGDCESNEDLYRIIGLFKNEEGKYEIKLIKAEGATATQLGDSNIENSAYIGKYGSNSSSYKSYYQGTNYDDIVTYYWNSTSKASTNANSINMWKDSNFNKVNLNDFYFKYITNRNQYVKKYIVKYNWVIGGPSYGNEYFKNAKEIYDFELGKDKIKEIDNKCYDTGNPNTPRLCNQENDLIYESYIGLMYLSDYRYASLTNYWLDSNPSTDIDDNWMYMGLYEWAISRNSYYGNIVIHSCLSGLMCHSDMNDIEMAARPCFYLDSSVALAKGNGSKTKPYRLK